MEVFRRFGGLARRIESPDMYNIKVYGADWCEDTARTRHHLEALGVPYDYINIDGNEAAQFFIKRQNNGKQQTPTVDLGGRVLIEPSDPELDAALKAAGLGPSTDA
jgi:mycoredoxin